MSTVAVLAVQLLVGLGAARDRHVGASARA